MEISEGGPTRGESRAASAIEVRVQNHFGSEGMKIARFEFALLAFCCTRADRLIGAAAEQHQYASVNPLTSGPAPAIPVQQPPVADTAGDQGLSNQESIWPWTASICHGESVRRWTSTSGCSSPATSQCESCWISGIRDGESVWTSAGGI